jgi:hypothetical protein
MSDKIGEGEWVALVTRIEEAMCVIPFVPRQEDVITLLSMAVNGNQHALRVEDLEQQVERLRTLLRRIYEWDHMDTAADGPYWRSEIDKALARA